VGVPLIVRPAQRALSRRPQPFPGPAGRRSPDRRPTVTPPTKNRLGTVTHQLKTIRHPSSGPRHASQTCESDMRVRHASQTCEPDMRTRHANQTCEPDMRTRHANQTCEPDMRTRHGTARQTASRHGKCGHHANVWSLRLAARDIWATPRRHICRICWASRWARAVMPLWCSRLTAPR
jgi:hypothetical protein